MAIINKKDYEDINPKQLDEYLELMKSTDEIINDDIYNEEENIEQIRSEFKEDIEKAESDVKEIKDDYNSNKEEKYQELMKTSSVDFIVEKLEEELSKMEESNKNKLNETIRLVKDSLYLQEFLDKTYIMKYRKIDNDKCHKNIQLAYNKLNSSNKYRFADIKELKPVINSILVKEEYKKYTNTFLYYFAEFINKKALTEYAVYISFIINNIKYITLFPQMEQNKIIIDSLNKIFEEYFMKH